MLANSGGLFLYQQQNQQSQRRRDLQRNILSAKSEIISEELRAMSDDDSSVVLDFRDDSSDVCSVSRYFSCSARVRVRAGSNTSTAVLESAACTAAAVRLRL